MKFSTRTEYGLRAMVFLAKNDKNVSCSLSKISREEKISQAYLERLFSKLKQAKLVKSTIGANGGYQLTKKPDKIKILTIFEALEGSLAPYRCLDNHYFCDNFKNCYIHYIWAEINKKNTTFLNSLTIADLLKRGKAKK